MKDHHLPDDVRRWPTDPYALLGIAPGVSQRDLKKAYTSLIRRYRPEDAPEEFRRIRDAFEMVQQHIKFSWFAAPPPTEDIEFPPPAPEPPADRPVEHTFNLELDGPDAPRFVSPFGGRPLGFQEEVVQLWDKACAGAEELAYRRLREIYNEHPNEKDILLRLYWLLSLDPDLDHVRHPCDWLAEGLRSSGLAGPYRELYRRHVLNHPREALTDRYSRLLECPASPVLLGQFVEWRWHAAGRLGSWTTIAGDLQILGQRLASEDEDSWARLLFFGIDQLAWFSEEPARRVLQSCVREMEKLEHLHARHGESFSRLDFLLELAGVWRSFQPEAPSPQSGGQSPRWRSFLKLVPLTWTLPPHELRPIFLEHLDDWRSNVRAALELFDEVQTRAPILLAQLGRTLESFQFTHVFVPPPAPEEVEVRTRRFLSGVEAADYTQFRSQILDFCLREFFAPEWIAEDVESHSFDANLVGLFAQIRNDWPLRLLCQAYRVFWA